MSSVMQPWVQRLSWMQQSVLLTSLRGPDGLRKDHISKLLIRWLRRCVLYSAFDRCILDRPYDRAERRGGSFTGASLAFKPSYDRPFEASPSWQEDMHDLVRNYLRHVDEMPHHFQLHFMHAAEIIGYCHPDETIRRWWHECYRELVNDLHLFPEGSADMMARLGDDETAWRARESVSARHPGDAEAA
jgi:hypothetical protein